MISALFRPDTAGQNSSATVVAFPERPRGDSTLWRGIVDSLDFALQPIVSINSLISTYIAESMCDLSHDNVYV